VRVHSSATGLSHVAGTVGLGAKNRAAAFAGLDDLVIGVRDVQVVDGAAFADVR